MKSNLFTAFLLLLPTLFFSQNSNDKTVYLDSLGKETIEGNHFFYKIIKDYSVEKTEYQAFRYSKSGKIINEGIYKDKEAKIKNGEFIEYYPNGNKGTSTLYKESRPVGNKTEWYENGNKKLEAEYIKTEDGSSKYKINQFWDVKNKQTVIDGNGFYESDNGSYLEKGEIKNGFRNSTWTGTSHKNNYTYSDKYQDGKFISGFNIDNDGTRHDYFEIESKPMPKKGVEHFYKYVSKNFRYTRESINNKVKGKIIVQFVVDKNGEIADPKIKKSLGYGLDEEAIRVILSYGNWIPGEQRGQKVRVMYSIPITLQGYQ